MNKRFLRPAVPPIVPRRPGRSCTEVAQRSLETPDRLLSEGPGVPGHPVWPTGFDIPSGNLDLVDGSDGRPGPRIGPTAFVVDLVIKAFR